MSSVWWIAILPSSSSSSSSFNHEILPALVSLGVNEDGTEVGTGADDAVVMTTL